MKIPDRSDRLGELLRLGDPAGDGHEPSAAELARMRAEVLSVARETAWRRQPGWRAAAAVGLAAMLAATLLIWSPGDPLTPSGSSPAANGGAEADPTGRPGAARQIQFSTPGGTRVVWSLDPDFEV